MWSICILVQNATYFCGIPISSDWGSSFIRACNIFLGLSSRHSLRLAFLQSFLGFPLGSLGRLDISRLLLRRMCCFSFRHIRNLVESSRCSNSSSLSIFDFLQSPLGIIFGSNQVSDFVLLSKFSPFLFWGSFKCSK